MDFIETCIQRIISVVLSLVRLVSAKEGVAMWPVLEILWDIFMSWRFSREPGRECERDLNGRVVVVTGANAGIGKDTAAYLWERGADVVMACRSRERATAARNDIIAAARARGTGSEASRLVLMDLDLASLTSVRNFASEFNERYERLDILVLNAGLLGVPRTVTEDGNELLFQVHHVGHFLLTMLLLQALRKAAEGDGPKPRVVVVSSILSKMGTVDLDNLNFTKGGYNRNAAYANSKLHNVLFMRELHRRVFPQYGIHVNACHPGNIVTDVTRNLPKIWGISQKRLQQSVGFFFRNPLEGAATQIRMAVASELEGVSGKMFCDYNLEMPLTPSGKDYSLASALWKESVKICGLAPEQIPPPLQDLVLR